MPVIKPFCAVRPAKEYAGRIAALPYDVYDRKEAKVEVSKEPLSFLEIDRAETQFDDSVDIYADVVYERARDTYLSMKRDGYFITDERPCYYLYELTMNGRTQTGIVGCASIDDYINGTVKKHENTRADKEVDRIRHVDTMSAQTGPIFLAYHADMTVAGVVAKVKETDPLYDFTAPDQIRHRVWMISDDADVKTVADAFSSMDSVYIADGHHRCASAVKVGLKRREENPGYTGEEEFNFFLSVLFPDDELLIMDYNRVVKDLGGHGSDEILKMLEGFGSLTEKGKEPWHPVRKGEIGVYIAHTWYAFSFDPQYFSDDPVLGLDVSLLQEHILRPYFGIEDPRSDKRIEFVGGIRGLAELEKRADETGGIAFAMYPTRISELFAVADAGKLMPPKSTWFEPKLRSGLFIHEI
ncbi:MAG: DUF1015 domain-containing protein [Lachnospiraceae bacterium]|nr:DUF1015 domain-containing protein [Lachnospiraceae bacterium]